MLKFGILVRFNKSKTFIKFLIVGTMGYFVNAVLLGLLYRGQIYSLKVLPAPILNKIPIDGPSFSFITLDRLFYASLISIEASIIFLFVAHENWTFKDRAHIGPWYRRLLKFNFSSLASPAIQLLSILFFANYLHLNEQIGLAVGVIIGLSVNFTINMLWIWKKKH